MLRTFRPLSYTALFALAEKRDHDSEETSGENAGLIRLEATPMAALTEHGNCKDKR